MPLATERIFPLVQRHSFIFPGPATIRMVSTNSNPPMPMPLTVPAGHMVQQILGQDGTLQDVILALDPMAPPPPPGAAPPPPTATGTPLAGCAAGGAPGGATSVSAPFASVGAAQGAPMPPPPPPASTATTATPYVSNPNCLT